MLFDSIHFSILQTVYRAHVNYLMDNGETIKAVELFPHVYTTPEEWKEQINRFVQKNELDVMIDGERFELYVYSF